MKFLKALVSARRWFTLALTCILFLSALLALSAPLQIPVVHYKLVLTLLSGFVGYRLDRVLFPFAAPSSYLVEDWHDDPDADNPGNADFPVVSGYESIFCYAMIRQAVIVVGAMLSVGLGL